MGEMSNVAVHYQEVMSEGRKQACYVGLAHPEDLLRSNGSSRCDNVQLDSLSLRLEEAERKILASEGILEEHNRRIEGIEDKITDLDRLQENFQALDLSIKKQTVKQTEQSRKMKTSLNQKLAMLLLANGIEAPESDSSSDSSSTDESESESGTDIEEPSMEVDEEKIEQMNGKTTEEAESETLLSNVNGKKKSRAKKDEEKENKKALKKQQDKKKKEDREEKKREKANGKKKGGVAKTN